MSHGFTQQLVNQSDIVKWCFIVSENMLCLQPSKRFDLWNTEHHHIIHE